VNKDHFNRDAQFDAEVNKLPADLHQEFLDFLISSVTAEFSGCVLYSEIKRRVRNPDVRDLMATWRGTRPPCGIHQPGAEGFWCRRRFGLPAA